MGISGSDSASGTSMLDGFTTLGTKIHEDSLESMTYFQQLEKARRDRERQLMLDAQNKKQLGIQNAQTNRGQNLNAMTMLQNQRLGAQASANQRPGSFRDALASLSRGGM